MRCEDNPEDSSRASSSAVYRCAVEISVGSHHERAERVKTVGFLKQNQRRKNAISRNSEDCAQARNTASVVGRSTQERSAVKTAIVRLNQFSRGFVAIGKMKIEQGCQRTIGCDFEDRAESALIGATE